MRPLKGSRKTFRIHSLSDNPAISRVDSSQPTVHSTTRDPHCRLTSDTDCSTTSRDNPANAPLCCRDHSDCHRLAQFHCTSTIYWHQPTPTHCIIPHFSQPALRRLSLASTAPNMSMQYRQLDHSRPLVVNNTVDVCCGCFIRPACFSYVWSCPCSCSSTAPFAVAMGATWMAFLALVLASLNATTRWEYVWGNQTRAQQKEALSLISILATFTAGILSAIRLQQQQRDEPIRRRLSWPLNASFALAFLTASLVFVLSFSELDPNGLGYFESWTGWILQQVAILFLLIAAPLHIVAHCCYERNMQLQHSSHLLDVGHPAATAAVAPSPLDVDAQSPSPSPVHHPPAEAPSYHNHPPPAYESASEHRPSAPPAPPAISYGTVVKPIYLTPRGEDGDENV